jgi:hypothetical protein
MLDPLVVLINFGVNFCRKLIINAKRLIHQRERKFDFGKISLFVSYQPFSGFYQPLLAVYQPLLAAYQPFCLNYQHSTYNLLQKYKVTVRDQWKTLIGSENPTYPVASNRPHVLIIYLLFFDEFLSASHCINWAN